MGFSGSGAHGLEVRQRKAVIPARLQGQEGFVLPCAAVHLPEGWLRQRPIQGGRCEEPLLIQSTAVDVTFTVLWVYFYYFSLQLIHNLSEQRGDFQGLLQSVSIAMFSSQLRRFCFIPLDFHL